MNLLNSVCCWRSLRNDRPRLTILRFCVVWHPDTEEHRCKVTGGGFRGLKAFQSVTFLQAPKAFLTVRPTPLATRGSVIKAQVLAGGRDKGRFDTGLQGSVHKVNRYVLLTPWCCFLMRSLTTEPIPMGTQHTSKMFCVRSQHATPQSLTL